MKRRSIQNDPIGSTERDRGIVVQVNVLVDLEEISPTEQALKPMKPKRA